MKRIKLRALTEIDKLKTVEWNNLKEIKEMYAGHPFPVNIEMETQWFNNIMKSNIPTTVFGIELIKENKLIGLSILKNINLMHRKAEFGILLGDSSERGKGYSVDATVATLDFGFNQMNLHRIYLFVQKNNIRAIKLYERVGFKKEGELRASVFKNGTYIDEIVMGIMNSEFQHS